MSNPDTPSTLPDWSPDEKRILSQVKFAAEVLRLARPAAEKQQPWWERILAAPALITVLTIAGTGVIGTMLSGSVQNRMKEKELALATYKENLAAQLDVIKRAYGLMGAYIAGSENLIVISGPRWEGLKEQTELYEKAYNEADANWRKEVETLGFLISYHHQEGARLNTQWIEAKKAIEAYNLCAVLYYEGRRRPQNPEPPRDNPCASEYQVIQLKFQELSSVLEASRRGVWKRWGVLK